MTFQRMFCTSGSCRFARYVVVGANELKIREEVLHRPLNALDVIKFKPFPPSGDDIWVAADESMSRNIVNSESIVYRSVYPVTIIREPSGSTHCQTVCFPQPFGSFEKSRRQQLKSRLFLRSLEWNSNSKPPTQNVMQEHKHRFACARSQNQANISSVLFASSSGSTDVGHAPPRQPVAEFPSGKPNWTQLEHVTLSLTANLPHFFSRKQDYTIYSPDVVVENRINNKTIEDLNNLILVHGAYRMLNQATNLHVELLVQNILPLLDDGTVRVRWRIVSLGLVQSLAFLLKYKGLSTELVRHHGNWEDGTAVFYVGSDGLVHKVVIDKIAHDNERSTDKAKNLAEKLAEATGLRVPKPVTTST